MSPWLSESAIRAALGQQESAKRMAELCWLSDFWEHCVFSPDFQANESIAALIVPTEFGNTLVQQCITANGVLPCDAILGLYGIFAWHDILIDCDKTDLAGIRDLFVKELMDGRIRLPYTWGRELHDALANKSSLSEYEVLPHAIGWDFLSSAPIGVFQHGRFVSGPLGVLESAEHRWIPAHPFVPCFYRQGTHVRPKYISFQPAAIGVVESYSEMRQFLEVTFGHRSEWKKALRWHESDQCVEARTDYADICLVLADCVLGAERATLLESLLMTSIGVHLRKQLKTSHQTKGLASLPPRDLISHLDTYHQLQLLFTLRAHDLVDKCDKLIESQAITIPASEMIVQPLFCKS